MYRDYREASNGHLYIPFVYSLLRRRWYSLLVGTNTEKNEIDLKKRIGEKCYRVIGAGAWFLGNFDELYLISFHWPEGRCSVNLMTRNVNVKSRHGDWNHDSKITRFFARKFFLRHFYFQQNSLDTKSDYCCLFCSRTLACIAPLSLNEMGERFSLKNQKIWNYLRDKICSREMELFVDHLGKSELLSRSTVDGD